MRNLPSLRATRRAPMATNFRSRFDDFFGDFEKEFFGADRTLAERGEETTWDFSPAVDIEDSTDLYLISADLPGVKENEVKIDLDNRTLRISGERRCDTKDEATSYCERSHGRFVRSFTLPEAIDAKKIEAHFENGVLRVAIPKLEAEAPQEVKIQTGSPKSLMDRFLHRDEAKHS